MNINRTRVKYIAQRLIAFRQPRDWWLLIGAYRAKRNLNCPVACC